MLHFFFRLLMICVFLRESVDDNEMAKSALTERKRARNAGLARDLARYPLLHTMDPHSFTAIARVRALIVPVGGGLSEQQFQKYASMIRSVLEVRLVDLTPTRTQLFNPQGFPQGRVIFDYSTSLNDQESLFLHDFEPFRKTFVVIGVSNGQTTTDDLDQLQKLYKSSIVHNIVVFGDTSNESTHKDILYLNKANIETVLCDITHNFLEKLTDYHNSYQHLTLRSPGCIGETEKPLPKQKKRISSGSAISLSLTDPSQNKISLTTSTERRQARIRGRQQKIVGNLLLLAGKYNDALKEFNEAVVLLKSSFDNLWLGSALEGIAVCLIMLAFIHVPYQLPTVIKSILSKQVKQSNMHPSTLTPTSSPRHSSSSSLNLAFNFDFNNASLHEVIYKIYKRVIQCYEQSRSDPDDYVPNLVYCESLLRLLKLMTVTNWGNGITDAVLDYIVKNDKSPLIESKSKSQIFDKIEILKLSNKILSVSLKRMDILSQTKVYSSLSTIYGDLGFVRKRGLILRSLFISLIPELTNTSKSLSSHHLSTLLNSLLSIYGVGKASESHIEDSYGSKWTQLHKSIIHLCIVICDKVKDQQSVAELKALLLTRYLHSLTDNEQSRTLNDIKHILRNFDVSLSYFDPFLVRGIELVVPINPPKKEKRAAVRRSNDPFIYNPYEKKDTSEKPILVQGELVEFILTLQNPFSFPLEINEIQIAKMELIRNHFVIPPKQISHINILAKPLEHGSININCITAKIFDCEKQEFKIVNESKPEIVKKLKNEDEVKPIILSRYNENLSTNNIEERVTTAELSLDVIHAQPSVHLSSRIDPMMLLEGERQSIQIKLKNNSPITVNTIELSIWDSTTEPLKEALEDKSLPSSEIYEIEYFLFRKALEIKTEIKVVNPFEEVTLDVDVIGKRGLNTVNLFVDYGHKEDKDVYTRRLEIPIQAVVNTCTDLAGCDIIPLVQNIDSEKADFWKFINESGQEASDFCLFTLDLRNIWNKALTVYVELEGFKLNRVIVPLETKRLLLPIKRFNVGEKATEPIPSLAKKQYTRPKMSRAEDMFRRESFWYRDEILKKLHGRWTIGDLNGDIELRGLRLSQKMISILQVDEVSIDFKLKDVEFEKKGLYHCIKTEEFFTVNVKIQNNSKRDIKGIIRNVPLSLSYGSVERRLLFNGALQQILKDKIKAGDSYELDIGAVVLESGDYEWGAMFDDLDSEDNHVSRRPIRIKAY